MQEYSVIGLMSGTSVDGLDIALCSFAFNDNLVSVKIKKAESVEYSAEMREGLLKLHTLDAKSLRKADIDFAKFCAVHINKFKSGIKEDILLIASHGHTVFHNPEESYTLQIGSGEVIAKLTGIACVYDFRSGDIALGGQGAPLVPIGDELLFGQYDACLNLGGFSNVSFRNAGGQRVAYDISAVNIVLNELAGRLGLKYDDKGKAASSGKLIPGMLYELDALEYYAKKTPKSLSREWVGEFVRPVLDRYAEAKTEDLLHTFAVHSAKKIATELNGRKNVLITGGGAFNGFFISVIKENTDAEIVIPQPELINFKEAVVFAFSGLLRYLNKNNCLASVTGAERDSCSGSLAMP